MTAFDTPEPISVTIDLVVGDVRTSATDRADTVVEVHPSDAAHEPDVRAAEQTRVEFAAGRLLVKAPKQKRLGLFGRTGSIDVRIDLPTGSKVDADADVAAVQCHGRLGGLRVKSGVGDIQVDEAGPVDLHTGAGAIVVERVVGNAEVNTGSGRIRLREIDGTAMVKNSNGDIWVGQVAGDLRASTANGAISIEQAKASVTANSANGDVRVGEVARGSTSLKTAMGEIEIGVRSGTAAQLDVRTRFGRVHNQMNAFDGPQPSEEEAVTVRAHTSYGDIIIRRAQI